MSAKLSLEALSKHTHVNAATLKHWIKKGVIPRPLGKGRASHYDQRHVLRALVARRMRTERATLTEIRMRIAPLTDAELRSMLPHAARGDAQPDGTPKPPPATTYPFTNWQLVSLADGLALMVDPDKPIMRRIADEIFRFYAMPSAHV